MIAALFVETDGVYANLPDVDCWPKERDARKYAGPWPVVAHPPCERWSMISMVNHVRWGAPINDDGGCFFSALSSIRKFGGVLEHPAESRAFEHHHVPNPTSRGWQLTIDGDWITEVNQAAYGHRATKKTWLIYHGECEPLAADWARMRGSCQIGGFDVTLPQLPKRERARTPEKFRDFLLALARHSAKKRVA